MKTMKEPKIFEFKDWNGYLHIYEDYGVIYIGKRGVDPKEYKYSIELDDFHHLILDISKNRDICGLEVIIPEKYLDEILDEVGGGAVLNKE